MTSVSRRSRMTPMAGPSAMPSVRLQVAAVDGQLGQREGRAGAALRQHPLRQLRLELRPSRPRRRRAQPRASAQDQQVVEQVGWQAWPMKRRTSASLQAPAVRHGRGLVDEQADGVRVTSPRRAAARAPPGPPRAGLAEEGGQGQALVARGSGRGRVERVERALEAVLARRPRPRRRARRSSGSAVARMPVSRRSRKAREGRSSASMPPHLAADALLRDPARRRAAWATHGRAA